MDPVGSFSGVVSGIDFRSLVDQIIALERRPADRLQSQIDTADAQLSALSQFESLLTTFRDSASKLRDGTAFDGVSSTLVGLSTDGSPLLSVTADSGADPGTYQLQVLSLANAEKLGSTQFASATDALNLSGEFFINGTRIQVDTTDSLVTVRDKINDALISADGGSVRASILSISSTENQLILTSDKAGSAGIDIKEGSSNILQSLGFVDTSEAIKHATSSGAQSDVFTASSTAIGTLLGLTEALTPQNVTIGGQAVSIDLSVDSLDAIATRINALTGVSASVVSNTDSSGNTTFTLDISGTTSFVDAANTLQLLGVLEGGRSAVAQSVRGDALTDGDAVTTATATTLLSSLFSGGQAGGVQTGDTFTINGTRGDGSTVNLTYTVGAGDTVQTLLDFLNNTTNGFKAGTRTATASIDAQGRIRLTDDTAGASQLSLSIVTHNEGGGQLDFGSMTADQFGRNREIVTGTDAKVSVDGATFIRNTNTLTDVVPGATLNLLLAEPGTNVSLTIDRAVDKTTSSLQDFVQSYNDVVSFIKSQVVTDPDATNIPALARDATVKGLRRSISSTLLSSITGVSTSFSAIFSVGLSLDKDGVLSLDTSKLSDVFANNFNDLKRLFTTRGSTDNSAIKFIGSGDLTTAGTYAVNITQAATQAAVTGTGFTGTYVDDATADTITVTDTVTGFSAAVQLTNGMTTAQIVSALNTAFADTRSRQVETGSTLYSDATQTSQVTSTTLFQDIFLGTGANAGVAASDTVGYQVTLRNGAVINGTYTVTDPSVDTLGNLTSQIQSDLGNDYTVAVQNGRVAITDKKTGISSLNFVLLEGNEGGGALDFGTEQVVEPGKGVMSITAAAQGNDISITHDSYGSTPGFTIAFAGGGTDNTAQLGITAQTYNGLDVAGTIGGNAATGSGRILVGDTGSPVDGLSIEHQGTTTGAAGNVTLTLGIGSLMERLLDSQVRVGDGTLDIKEKALDERKLRLQSRIDVLEGRLERRRQALLRQFTQMEVTIGRLNAQSQALGAQSAGLNSILGGAK